jgi:uncharacterized membrane protein
VSAQLEYRAPGGIETRTVERLMGVRPDRDLAADLLRFKLLAEAAGRA